MKFIVTLAYILLGALNIFAAIGAFKDGHDFVGGLNIMIAVWMAAGLFKIV